MRGGIELRQVGRAPCVSSRVIRQLIACRFSRCSVWFEVCQRDGKRAQQQLTGHGERYC